MKLINKLSPKSLFKSNKKDKSHVSKFDSSLHSSGSVTSSSESFSSVHKSNQSAGLATPTTVLPELSANFYLELVEAFKTIDKDNDGFITRSELEDLLSKFASQPPCRGELSESECDDDEFLSLETLMGQLVAGSTCDEPACKPDLREIFYVFDTDHDGKITAEELMAFYKEKIGDERCILEDCQLMIASVDKNGDGFVCFEDFSRMMELQS